MACHKFRSYEPQTRIQVKHQFVIKPRYCIYVDGGIEGKLLYMLKRESFKFTLYLGTAYAIADIQYIGHFETEPLKKEKYRLIP